MVTAKIKKQIENLKKGDLITVKNEQRSYNNCGMIQPNDIVVKN